MDDIAAAASDPGSAPATALRRKLEGAIDYLGPAQVVVQVVTDLELDTAALDLERLPHDDERVAALTARWGLGTSAERLTAALSPPS
ncbi:hypothetical protein ACSDQ9_08280 [Aestuariimicrobium soli]|uniref:hypothetical protein n=1 Tax=Aestuariimicrobium soli TaxID=2035834 RepID=UPI003EBA4341